MDAEVGFTVQGQTHPRTVGRPCMFDNFCNLGDYNAWLIHAEQWMFAVLNRMKTDAERKAMAPMVRELARLKRADISFLDRFQLTEDTLKLRNMCANLKEVAAMLGQPVQVGEVTLDLSRPTVELPIPGDLAEVLGWDWSFDKFLSDLMGGASDILGSSWLRASGPWILLGILGLMAAKKGKLWS